MLYPHAKGWARKFVLASGRDGAELPAGAEHEACALCWPYYQLPQPTPFGHN